MGFCYFNLGEVNHSDSNNGSFGTERSVTLYLSEGNVRLDPQLRVSSQRRNNRDNSNEESSERSLNSVNSSESLNSMEENKTSNTNKKWEGESEFEYSEDIFNFTPLFDSKLG